MHIRIFRAAAAAALLILSQSSSALMIDLFSGNGSVGGPDSDVTFLLGPANSAFASPFTTTDFADASSGPAAEIIVKHPSWITLASFAGAGGNPSAQWISDNTAGASAGSTALYAIDFSIPFGAIGSALMDFYWSVDNVLGDITNAAVFLNGVAVSGPGGGTFTGTFSSLNLDVASLLIGGTNTLYINSIDEGGPGGLIFSAALIITEDNGQPPPPNGVPAPAPVLLIGLGLVALWAQRRRIS